MTQPFRFDDRVAVVTGAGGGLGRAYAQLLAQRGAKVVVNDVGSDVGGAGHNSQLADQVVDEIRATGGEAIPSYHSVENGDQIIEAAIAQFGRVDILINNAGILRDRSFHKLSDEEWERVYQVHLYGSFKTTRAAWPIMREQRYGRIVMITSTSGIYGNFGQANYSAAKLGMAGLAFTLAIEGAGRNIQVNAVAPTAGSRMTETVMAPELVAALKPQYVAPLVAYLCHQSCRSTGAVYEGGAGWFARVRWQRSNGVGFNVADGAPTIEDVASSWEQLNDWQDATNPTYGDTVFAPMMANIGRS